MTPILSFWDAKAFPLPNKDAGEFVKQVAAAARLVNLIKSLLENPFFSFSIIFLPLRLFWINNPGY
jgi:hypothetical protein